MNWKGFFTSIMQRCFYHKQINLEQKPDKKTQKQVSKSLHNLMYQVLPFSVTLRLLSWHRPHCFALIKAAEQSPLHPNPRPHPGVIISFKRASLMWVGPLFPCICHFLFCLIIIKIRRGFLTGILVTMSLRLSVIDTLINLSFIFLVYLIHLVLVGIEWLCSIRSKLFFYLVPLSPTQRLIPDR